MLQNSNVDWVNKISQPIKQMPDLSSNLPLQPVSNQQPTQTMADQFKPLVGASTALLSNPQQPNPISSIASSAGSTIGNMVLPGIGGALGGIAGSALGSLLGSDEQKKQEEKLKMQQQAKEQQSDESEMLKNMPLPQFRRT